jgi:putative Ca2+/H+ antiporter (TMEM165/GDT1 family)
MLAATITLATDKGWLGPWIGSTVGMVAADALAIVVGAIPTRQLRERAIKYGAALFAILSLLLIIEGVRL